MLIFNDLKNKNYFNILEILEYQNADSVLNPAQKFYKSCLNTGNLIFEKNLKTFFKH